jgi:uncharacterized membrane protein YebE (DUF533 family)
MAPLLLDRILGREEASMPEAPAEAPDGSGPEPAERALRTALAQKLLHAWMQNRQQILVPLILNLERLDGVARTPIVEAMAAALAACGKRDGADRARLAAALLRAGAKAEAAQAEAMLADPPELLGVLERLTAARRGPEAFAAVSLVLDRRDTVERAFLEWLALRLGLPASLTGGLARRYGR